MIDAVDKTPREVYWIGEVPRKCEVTGRPIVDEFVDGRTTMGPWANMHPDAHKTCGYGFGAGRGQRYRRQEDGRWKKVEG